MDEGTRRTPINTAATMDDNAISIFRERPIIENSGRLYIRVPGRGYYSRAGRDIFMANYGQLRAEQTINERSEFAREG